MKNLPALSFVLLMISCGTNPKIEMIGAYQMTSQVLNDGSKDSILDRKQLKIYTDKYFMYGSPNLTDSFANFGIGTYEIKNGKVYEYRFYTAEEGERSDTLVLDIEKTYNGYKQIIERIPIGGKNYKLTEEYASVSTDQKSPLDGAWKQLRKQLTADQMQLPNSFVNAPKTQQSVGVDWDLPSRIVRAVRMPFASREPS